MQKYLRWRTIRWVLLGTFAILDTVRVYLSYGKMALITAAAWTLLITWIVWDYKKKTKRHD